MLIKQLRVLFCGFLQIDFSFRFQLLQVLFVLSCVIHFPQMCLDFRLQTLFLVLQGSDLLGVSISLLLQTLKLVAKLVTSCNSPGPLCSDLLKRVMLLLELLLAVLRVLHLLSIDSFQIGQLILSDDRNLGETTELFLAYSVLLGILLDLVAKVVQLDPQGKDFCVGIVDPGFETLGLH